jgi:S-adenosylmethionine:tRNA ribosyltransferase-isomerase
MIFYEGYSKVIHSLSCSLVTATSRADSPHVRTADFDFDVPPELIAQTPVPQRDASRLFVLERQTKVNHHCGFSDLVNYLQPGDVLVLNNSRVIPARLRGVNAETGGQFEMLLLEEVALNEWWAMLRPAKRARNGTRIQLRKPDGSPAKIDVTVIAKNDEGHRRLVFSGVPNILERLDSLGEVPLPPYIQRDGTANEAQDKQRYQTVFAQAPGSVAAPTAGLHFTEPLLDLLRSNGVHVCFVTLHVGLGTFSPVKSDNLASHAMHEERYELSTDTAQTIQRAKAAGGRVVAVGTTSLRVLESVAADFGGQIVPVKGRTKIFIYPLYDFKIVDMLLTNFHLPRSTLVMLVSAFAAPGRTGGRERILSAYAEAIRMGYRFYSYGDAMLII